MSASVPPRGIPGVPVVLTKPSLSPWFGPLAIVRSINVRLSNQACRVATSFLSCVTNSHPWVSDGYPIMVANLALAKDCLLVRFSMMAVAPNGTNRLYVGSLP